LLLTACHSDYIQLDFRIYNGCYFDQDETEIAFLLKTAAFKEASGLSRFPDGGRVKFLRRELALYTYDTRSGRLDYVASFNDLVSDNFNIENSIKTRVTSSDSAIYLKITPTTAWGSYLEWCRSSTDSLYINTLKEKYERGYRIDRRGGNLVGLDIKELEKAFAGKESYSLTKLNQLIDSLPLSELGLNIIEIYPKTKQEYINETIYLKNPSPLSRRAVVEQIISKLEKKDIEALLDKMDEYKDSLEGYRKTSYEIHSKDTYELIKELLQ